MNHEEDISTKQPAPQEETRLPREDAHQERSESAGGSPPQGTPPPLRLTRGGSGSIVRLRRRQDYQQVYRLGQRAHGRWMVVFAYRRGVGGPENRFGITASRKVGGAVRRSRCKRRLRELYRQYGGVGREGIDLVANARRGLDRVPWHELVEEYLRCLRKLEQALEEPSESSGSTSGGSHRRSHRRAGTSRPAPNTPPRRS